MIRSLVALTLCWSFSLRAEEAEPQSVFGSHPGYLSDVKEERTKRDIEMVLLPPPKAPAPVRNVVFDEKLSKEFQEQYKYRFGQTSAEQVINSPGRYDEYTYYNNLSVSEEDYRHYQRQYGEYMARRLVEYHFDKWAKNDPVIRPVYQLKDRISNLDVKLKKGYKLKWKYSFSGPYMQATVENPYDIEAKVQAQMTGIVSAPAELIYSVGYPLNKKVKLSALHQQYDGVYQVTATRQMTKSISTSLTGQIDNKVRGDLQQQNLVLVGLSWND